MLAGLLVSSLLAAAPAVAWTRDYTKAFAQAEEQRRPLLLFFRNNCGGGNTPTNPVDIGGPIQHQEGLSPCDRMQEDVWESPLVLPLTERFLPVVLDGGDATLEVRYQAVRMPTTLVADPWGNEIFRVTGYLERDKMTRILQAIPGDFAALAPHGQALKKNGDDLAALMGAAQYYQANRLPQVSERLYEKAAGTGAAGADRATRRQVAIARGLNLLLMGRDKDAAGTFAKALDGERTAAGSDALLLGLVNAHLSGGRRKEAEAALHELEKGWPGSAYAKRARENFEGARKAN
jgi:hypothetical protein